MRPAIISAAIVIGMQSHNTTTLFYSLKVQSQTIDFFIFL